MTNDWLVCIVLIAFIGMSILASYYRKSFKESELRCSLKSKRVTDNEYFYKEKHNISKQNIVAYKLLLYLLLNSPVIYAKGSMRSFYEVRANGNIFSRVKVNKIGEPSKRLNVSGELYYKWTSEFYISRSDVITALGLNDPNKSIDYINNRIVTVESLKKKETEKTYTKKVIQTI